MLGSVSEGTEDIFPDDVKIKLSAVSEQIPAGSQSDAEEGQVQPDSPVDVEQEQAQPENDQEPPAVETGDVFPEAVVFSICATAALLMIGSLAIVRKKGRAGRVKILIGVIVIAAATALTVGGVYAFGGKGDLNGDGAVDYTDVHMLQ